MSGTRGVKILSKELDYSSPPMDVLRYEIEDSSGKKRPYWVLDRKNEFSIVIPIFPDKTTVLIGQYRVPIEEFSWEFAMGTVAGATPLQAAKQELKEESGLSAKKWQKIGDFFLAPGVSSQIGHVYLATDLTVGSPEPEEDEILESKRITLEEVGKMIESHEIKDGPTIISWQFLQKYL